MKKIVVISHSAVLRENRKKWHLLSQLAPDWQINLLVPKRWTEKGRSVQAERETNAPYRLWKAEPLLPNKLGLYTYPNLSHWLQAQSPNLIYLEEEPWSFIARQSIAVAAHQQIPVGLFTAEGKSNRKYPFPYSANLKTICPKLSFVLAETKAGESLVKRFGYRGTVLLSHIHGIDEQCFYPAEKRDPNRKTTLGFIGRLAQEKGVADLLHAAAPFRQQVKLYIVGEGQEKRTLQSLAKQLKLEAAFTGYVAENLLQHYHQIDLFVLPSHTTRHWAEGINRSLLQAMASAICCIGSASGGTAQLLKGVGFLYPPGDIPALQSIIQALLLNPRLRTKAGLQSFERFKERYALPPVAQTLHSAFAPWLT